MRRPSVTPGCATLTAVQPLGTNQARVLAPRVEQVTRGSSCSGKAAGIVSVTNGTGTVHGPRRRRGRGGCVFARAGAAPRRPWRPRPADCRKSGGATGWVAWGRRSPESDVSSGDMTSAGHEGQCRLQMRVATCGEPTCG